MTKQVKDKCLEKEAKMDQGRENKTRRDNCWRIWKNASSFHRPIFRIQSWQNDCESIIITNSNFSMFKKNHLLPKFCFTTCIACLVTSRVSFITSSVWAKDKNQLWWGWIRIPKRQHSELKVMPLGLWNGSSPWKGGIISEGFFNVVYVILKRDVLNHYSSTIQPLLRSWGTGI